MNRTPFPKGLGSLSFSSGFSAVPSSTSSSVSSPLPSRPAVLSAAFSLTALLVATLSFCCSPAAAQAPSQTPLVPGGAQPSGAPASGSLELQRRGVDLESSQPDVHEQYLLGGGDEITVTVAGRPELSGNHIVGPDGRITLPMVGSLDLGEKSRDEAAAAIDDALGKYYSGKVLSTVQVTKYGSNHVLLLGAVEHAGVINFDQPPTLLQVITQGGALSGSKSGGTPKRCVVFRGQNQVMNVNISERLDGQKALNDIRLRRNDIVYVPANQESLISVLGEVFHPGAVELTPQSTLVSLLADSGGITPQAGNPEILIVEPSTGRRQQIKFKELLKLQKSADITLHDGDIVYVPRSGLATVGFTLQQISPITQLGSIAAIALR
jgi:polysaccharide biosynthesis/export protein